MKNPKWLRKCIATRSKTHKIVDAKNSLIKKNKNEKSGIESEIKPQECMRLKKLKILKMFKIKIKSTLKLNKNNEILSF